MKAFTFRIISAVLTIIFFSSLGFSQDSNDSKKVIDSLATKMFVDMNNRDYAAIMDMTHPKVFDLVPRETMISAFKSMLEGNDEFSVEIPDEVPEFNISEVFKDDEEKSDFAFVTYDMEMAMTFKNESFDEAEKDTMIKMMKMQGMEATFESDNTLNLKMLNRMTVLIKDESTENRWAMINYDPDSPLFFQLLSAPVIEKAKSYYQDLMIAQKKKE
ncbi:MAG: hypothetical protein Tsb0033_07230 [Winogradskyella sp.]